MRLRSLLAGALALAATSAALIAAPAAQASVANDPEISSQLVKEIKEADKVRSIIEVKPGESVTAVARKAEDASDGAKVIEKRASADFFVAEVDTDTLDKLKADDRIEAIYKDQLMAPSLEQSTKLIGSDKANEAGYTGTGTTVAVLDTGIDRDHPFFAGRIVGEACFSTTYAAHGAESLCPGGAASSVEPGAADAETERCRSGSANMCAHGSHVAGIAAGKKTAGAPASGVAPEAGILPVQVFSRFNLDSVCRPSTGRDAPCVLSYLSDQMFALDHVAQVAGRHQVVAVNMSLGGGLFTTHCDGHADYGKMKPLFDALIAAEVAPVVAAGNAGNAEAISAPACLSNAIAVGATDDQDAIAPFSNRGPLLDLFAPGLEINSSVPGNTYTVASGTSMAAPHVAGAFAVLKQAYPDMSVAAILAKLQKTGKDITNGNVRTKRINLAKAVTPKPTPTVTPTPSPTATATATPTATVTVRPDPDVIILDPDPEPLPPVCTRGNGTKPLSSKAWAKEMLKTKGSLSDQRLLCYLSLAQNGSAVFPEASNAGTLARAYQVLATKSKSAKALLDRELLAAWLNHAHGVHDASDKVNGRTTFKQAIGAAEKHRLKSGAAQQRKAAAYLFRHVNR